MAQLPVCSGAAALLPAAWRYCAGAVQALHECVQGRVAAHELGGASIPNALLGFDDTLV